MLFLCITKTNTIKVFAWSCNTTLLFWLYETQNNTFILNYQDIQCCVYLLKLNWNLWSLFYHCIVFLPCKYVEVNVGNGEKSVN